MTVKVSRLGEELSKAVEWEVEGDLVLETSSNVLLNITPENITSLVRDGDDLIVETADGQVLKIVGFYTEAGEGASELYLVDNEGGVVWADLSPAAENGVVAAQYVPQADMAGFEMVAAAEESGGVWTGAAILGGAAAAGLAAAAAGGGGGSDDDGSGQDHDDGSDDDVTAPSAPEIGAIRDDQGAVTGPLANGDSTDDATPTLSGSAEAGSTITIRDGDTVLGTATADDSGNWSFTPSEPLAEGSHSLSVTATDPAGNTSEASDAVELTVDTAAPEAPTLNPSDGTVISGSAESGSTIALDLDGDGTADLMATADETTGEWSVKPTSPLADDTVITVTATDAAGNASPEASLTVDAAAPAAPVIAEVVDDEGDFTGPLSSGDSTDDATPTLSGTAEAGSTVTIRDGDTVLESITVADSGSWSFTPSEPLADGSHSLTATATDPTGNTSEPSDAFDVSVDTAAPEVPTITSASDNVGDVTDPLASGDSTDDTTPTLSGTAEADSTVTIFDGDTVLGSAEADGSGNWSFTPADPLTAGDYSFTATATDDAGNTSEASDAFDVRVDTAAPEVPTIASASDNVGDVTGELANGDSTDDTTPTLTGTAEADSTVTIFDGDTVLGSAEADGSGSWSFTPADPLTEGDYSFTATATDDAGNSSAVSSPAVEFSVDTTSPGGDDGADAPTLTITEAADGAINADELADGVQASVGLTAGTQAGDTITLSIDNADDVTYTVTDDDVTNDSATVVIPSDSLVDGDYSVTAVITDEAGNSSVASNNIDFTVDATSPGGDDGNDAPTLAIAEAADGQVNADELDDGVQASVGLTDGTEAGDTITLSIDGAEDVTYNVTADDANAGSANVVIPSSVLEDGDYSVTAVITDDAGNSSVPSNGIDFSVDGTSPGGDDGNDAPTLAIAEAADGINADELADGVQASVGLTAGTQAGDTITLSIDNADDVTYTVTADDANAGSANVVIPSSVLEDGDYSVTAVITDDAGNSSVASNNIDFTVDATSPGGDDGNDAPTLAIAEAADGAINADELADGVQASVGLTAGTQAGDT
ncbi:Ig-like domain-containing protein, partial [Halomonas borealis]|uniref:Ig-like domain-containing protein n=1 Tax=Halomonas borealis TaxID=2508710 RepID=UPI0014487B42